MMIHTVNGVGNKLSGLLDCMLTEFNCFNVVDYVGVLDTPVKYHGVRGGLTYFKSF